MGAAIPRRLHRVVAQQRRTLHLPAVDLAVQTLARLALVRPLLAVHEDDVGQLLVPTSVLLVALRTTPVLVVAWKRAVATGLLTAHHAVVAQASLAGVFLRGQRQPVPHFRPLEHATEAAVFFPGGTFAAEAPLEVDALSRGMTRVELVRTFINIYQKKTYTTPVESLLN